MIAVDGIDTHQQCRLQLVRMLTIPTECESFEPVSQGDQTAVPVRVMHVENIHVRFPQGVDASLDAFLDACETRGVNDPRAT